MAMFDDPKKELAKLEAQLLKEEEWFNKELDMAKALIGDEPAPKKTKKPAQAGAQAKTAKSSGGAKKVRNNESYDVDLDTFSEDVRAPKQKGVKGLVILAILETLGIVGIVAYWVLFLL